MISSLTPDPDRSVEIRTTQQGNISRYVSRILDVDSQVVLLAQPFRNGRPVALRPGQQITVCLKDAGGLWYFDTIVQKVYRTPRPMLLILQPAELNRLQRRQYVREDVRIAPARFTLFDKTLNRGYRLQATIVNVSGGGVKFTAPILIPEGTTVKMGFELPEGYGEVRATGVIEGYTEVKATGIVVHNRLVSRPGNASYSMGVAFTQIPHAHREATIRFVLYHQARRARARWE